MNAAAIPDKAFEYGFLELSPEEWKGKTFGRYVGETVLALEPDVVVTHAWQNADATAVVRRSGVRVVELPDLRSYDDVLATLELLGRELGAEERARELRAELDARCAALDARPKPARRRVLPYSNFGSTGWTAGKGTTADVFIRLAGLVNAAAEAGLEGHVNLDNERLLAIDPDYILVGTAPRDPGYSIGAEYLRSEPSLQGLRAIRDGRVIVLTAKLVNASSHHVVDAAEALLDAID